MIRRVFSIVFFILGGWLFSAEIMIAFLDLKLGTAVSLIGAAFITLMALPFLLIGAWASPGHRWRELGLTLLIVAGLAIVSGVTIWAVFTDPAMKPFLPPETFNVDFAPALGFANLLLVCGVGWLLYRKDNGLGSSSG